MRHRVAGRHLNRTSSHRKAMYRNMAASLIEHGAIRTTEPKAKELRRFIERLITIAKKGTLHARRQAISLMNIRHAVNLDEQYTDPWVRKRQKSGKTTIDVLFDEVAPRFAGREGGYTRIIRLADRRIGDGSAQVVLQLVEETKIDVGSSGSSRRRRRAEKRYEAVAAIAKNTSAAQASQAEAETQEATSSPEAADQPTETDVEKNAEGIAEEATEAADEGEEKTDE